MGLTESLKGLEEQNPTQTFHFKDNTAQGSQAPSARKLLPLPPEQLLTPTRPDKSPRTERPAPATASKHSHLHDLASSCTSRRNCSPSQASKSHTNAFTEPAVHFKNLAVKKVWDMELLGFHSRGWNEDQEKAGPPNLPNHHSSCPKTGHSSIKKQ